MCSACVRERCGRTHDIKLHRERTSEGATETDMFDIIKEEAAVPHRVAYLPLIHKCSGSHVQELPTVRSFAP